MAYPATYSDIRSAVISKVRLDATDDVTRVGQWINEVYSDVAAETRCFQQDATTTITTATAGDSFTLDSTVLHIELVTLQQSGGSPWLPLVEAQLDEVLNYRALAPVASGPARRYCLVGQSEIEFWPALVVGDVLHWWYSYMPTALTNNNDVPGFTEPFASNLLEYGASIKAAEWKRDIMMLSNFQQQYGYWLGRFQTYVNRKAGAYPSAFPTWTSGIPFGPHDPSTDLPDSYYSQV